MAEPYGTHSDHSEQPDGNRYGERLVVRSVPVPDPGEGFLAEIPDPAAVAWVRQAAGRARTARRALLPRLNALPPVRG